MGLWKEREKGGRRSKADKPPKGSSGKKVTAGDITEGVAWLAKWAVIIVGCCNFYAENIAPHVHKPPDNSKRY